MLKSSVSMVVGVFGFGLIFGVADVALAGSKIAFECKIDSVVPDICTINPDGSGFLNITNTPNVEESNPTWSPDGTRIAFVVETPENDPEYGISVMDADGGNRHRVLFETPTGVFLDFDAVKHAWSPELPSRVAAISPLGQFVVVFLLGGATALYLNREREPGAP